MIGWIFCAIACALLGWALLSRDYYKNDAIYWRKWRDFWCKDSQTESEKVTTLRKALAAANARIAAATKSLTTDDVAKRS